MVHVLTPDWSDTDTHDLASLLEPPQHGTHDQPLLLQRSWSTLGRSRVRCGSAHTKSQDWRLQSRPAQRKQSGIQGNEGACAEQNANKVERVCKTPEHTATEPSARVPCVCIGNNCHRIQPFDSCTKHQETLRIGILDTQSVTVAGEVAAAQQSQPSWSASSSACWFKNRFYVQKKNKIKKIKDVTSPMTTTTTTTTTPRRV